LTATTVRI